MNHEKKNTDTFEPFKLYVTLYIVWVRKIQLFKEINE